MKFKNYVSAVNNLLLQHPNSGEMEVIYSSDDEGNSYHLVSCTPDLLQVEDLEERWLEIVSDEEGNTDITKANVVIIN